MIKEISLYLIAGFVVFWLLVGLDHDTHKIKNRTISSVKEDNVISNFSFSGDMLLTLDSNAESPLIINNDEEWYVDDEFNTAIINKTDKGWDIQLKK